ncbi:MAG: glycosyltransferase [Actinomycetota bacterium]|nr:glycosyltransferase [Actinomycetota bacterium]
MAHRVLYVVDSLGMGGAERGLSLTLRHLDRTRFEPEVAMLWEPDTLARDLDELGVRVHKLGARRGPAALLVVPRLRRLLRRRRFDAAHTQVLWASITGRIAGRLAGVKVISHVLNVDPGRSRNADLPSSVALKVRIVGALDEWTGRLLVDRFIAISEAVRAHPIRGRSWDRSKISVVDRGQDVEALTADAERQPSPPLGETGQPVILSVGRLAPQKGHRYLIRAMADVVHEYPSAQLLVAGEGHLADELKAIADPLGDHVHFLGVRRDVPALLVRADVFVFPSLWEGVGNALREAMLLGKPVVATDIPAHRGYVTDGIDGLLVPPADAEALASAVLRLLREPEEAAGIGKRAAETAARFDIRRTTRELESVYDEVLR